MVKPAFWTLPNFLTLSRLPMAALIWMRPRDPIFVLSLMALAGITDVLDGWLERRRRARMGLKISPAESVGAWLDPVCDKVFVLSLLTAMTVAHDLPVWIIPVLAFREILQGLVVLGARVVPGLRKRLRPRFQANVLGKAATVAQFITVAAILLKAPGQVPLAILTGLLGAIAVTVYVLRSMD